MAITAYDLVKKYGSQDEPALSYATLILLAQYVNVTLEQVDATISSVQNYFNLPLPTGGSSGVTTKSKLLTNNASTNLFTLPLGSGEAESIHIRAHVLAKKGTDWSLAMFEYVGAIYNDGTTLQTIIGASGDNPSSESKTNLGSISAAVANGFGASLNSGVVTVSYNPGSVGTSPDSITIYYYVMNPGGNTITYL